MSLRFEPKARTQYSIRLGEAGKLGGRLARNFGVWADVWAYLSLKPKTPSVSITWGHVMAESEGFEPSIGYKPIRP